MTLMTVMPSTLSPTNDTHELDANLNVLLAASVCKNKTAIDGIDKVRAAVGKEGEDKISLKTIVLLGLLDQVLQKV